jgi:hypothetical protein
MRKSSESPGSIIIVIIIFITAVLFEAAEMKFGVNHLAVSFHLVLLVSTPEGISLIESGMICSAITNKASLLGLGLLMTLNSEVVVIAAVTATAEEWASDIVIAAVVAATAEEWASDVVISITLHVMGIVS